MLAVLYLATSAVVLINSFRSATGAAWLPSLPEGYYAFERALNLPFRPWFTLLRPLQERADLSYASWALLSRGPVFGGALAVLCLSLRALLRPGR
ncbi:MAG: hypothetical protein NVSMB23_02900 [Myxococcales bacterium]